MVSMREEIKKRSEFVQKIIFVLYCLFCGCTMMVFSILGYTAERVSLGILFLLASVFHIYEFHHYNRKKIAGTIYFVLSIAGISLGVWTLIDSNLELWVVCLVFGIMDVLSGILEIITNAIVLKKPFNLRTNITEYCISTADVIFGVLLIISLEKGLLVHIVYLAIVFLINAAVALTEIAGKIGRHE